MTDASSTKTAVVLAGGLGLRLRNAVPELPKVMAAVNGRPFLEYLLDYWIRQGIRNFVVSVGYRRQAIMDHFRDRYRGIPITYSIEETPRGTGGGLVLALGKIGPAQSFLLLNGDSFFEVPLNELIEFHVSKRSDWTFTLFNTTDASRYMAIETDANGRLVKLGARPTDASFLANGGVYLVNASVLAGQVTENQPVSLERDILPDLFARQVPMFGYECAGRFIDIGLPQDYARAGEILKPKK